MFRNPLLRPIELVDKSTVVQLFDKAHLGEILRLGGFCLWVFFTEGVENHLDPVQGRVLFSRQDVFGHGTVVGFF